MTRRLAAVLAVALFAVLPTPATAGVGDPIDHEEQRVSEHGFRFGAEQSSPDISSRYIVWQDRRGTSTRPSGNALWMKDLTTRSESPVTTLATEHANPRISSGNWVVWTSRAKNTGNDDIFARKLPSGTIIRVTTNSANQMNPSIDGTLVAWEDYRNGNVDIYERDLRTMAREKPVVVAPGDQTSPSVSGKTVAWRDGRRGATTADVYVRSGTAPEIRVAPSRGLARPLSNFQVAVSGNRLLWNEPDAVACDAGDCEPKTLRSVTIGSITPDTVDSVSGSYNRIVGMDMNGTEAVWAMVGSENHVFACDLTACTPAQVDTAPPPAYIAESPRVDGPRFAWVQDGIDSQGGTRPSGSFYGDVYWRPNMSVAPARANSVGLGPFGEHVNPTGNSGFVLYRGLGEQGTFVDRPNEHNLARVWATEFSPRHYYSVSTVLGTDHSRPVIQGTRVTWSDLSNCTSFATCPDFSDDTFDRDPPDPGIGILRQLSIPDKSGGSPDADGGRTVWRCSDTSSDSNPQKICIDDLGTLSKIDLSPFLLSPTSVVSNVVRVSGDKVAWYEYDPSTDDRALHVHEITGGDDEIVGHGPDQVGDFADFDIEGDNILWSGSGDPFSGNSKLWLNAATADCGVDPSPCDHSAAATVFETPWFGHTVGSVSLGSGRAAWVDNADFTEGDIYTRLLSEPDAHLVTNESSSRVDSPYVAGDRIYWVDYRNGNADIYAESISGAAMPAADVTAPAKPTGFTAGANTGSIALAWTNPTAFDFYRVRILRKLGIYAPTSLDDQKASVVYEGNGTAFTDTDVAVGKKYSYSIFAYDYEPNYSARTSATSL